MNSSSREQTQQHVLGVVAGVTGHALADLDGEMFLEGELGLDSIKMVELANDLLDTVPQDRRQALSDRVASGDVILTFTEGYVSNLFLPGVFKHGIVYVGSPVDREAVGLTEEVLWRRTRVVEHFERLKSVVATAETEAGRPADVVEAVAEGVKFSSLEYLLAPALLLWSWFRK